MRRISSRTPTGERILQAAIELFGSNGIRGTSIEQVAEAAGVHRVTVHRLFSGGRDELVAEVLLSRALDALTLALPSSDDERSYSGLLVASFTSFVMLARTDPLIHEGLCSDAAQLVFAPERFAQLIDMTLTWHSRIAPSAARDGVEFLHDLGRVADLFARTVLTLVREPGIVVTEDDVSAYLNDFIIPAITHPVSQASPPSARA